MNVGHITYFSIKALEIWSKDMRGHRHGLWRIQYYNTALLIVATPMSLYR